MAQKPYRYIQYDPNKPTCWDEPVKEAANQDRVQANPEVITPLVYEGHVIRDRGEMLNLTDMLVSDGRPLNRDPASWRRLEDTERFVQSLVSESNMGENRIEVFQTFRGGNKAGTWAHWQVGLTYAQYLSPKFRRWCNTVVKERMEAMHRAGQRIPEDEVVEIVRRAGHVLSEADLHIIGSILKGVLVAERERVAIEREHYREQLRQDRLTHKAEIEAEMKAMVTAQIAAAMPEPVRNMISIKQILSEYGIERGSRGRIGIHLRHGLDDRVKFEASRGRPYDEMSIQCQHSGHWLYDRKLAEGYIKEVAKPMLDRHRAKARSGQGVIEFPLVDSKAR